jgi:FMN-dependent NADH-azoreductase
LPRSPQGWARRLHPCFDGGVILAAASIYSSLVALARLRETVHTRHRQPKPMRTPMPNLLVVEVSPRFDYSTSRKLTSTFVDKWKTEHPDGTVVVRDLAKSNLPFVDLPWIGGAFTPPEQHSPESAASIKISNDLVAELKMADHIVIGTPLYNFNVPAALKAWIDHVVRVGVTFTMAYEGLLKGKKATIILTSGSDFSPGTPYESYNQGAPYLRQILGFIGITDVNVILAGRALTVDQGEKTMDEFIGQFARQLAAAAAA